MHAAQLNRRGMLLLTRSSVQQGLPYKLYLTCIRAFVQEGSVTISCGIFRCNFVWLFDVVIRDACRFLAELKLKDSVLQGEVRIEGQQPKPKEETRIMMGLMSDVKPYTCLPKY